ncbi:uncharacterized protein LOC128236111 [Mya arenaria]|uniref:uncharacterized protein LOC128236111 n=1 Tax=Mya arenaria TaxID=6604 RepID=UPI0022E2B9EC|nr:uncharacterized protein LOC128236111 [Mya arenaria]
MTSEDDGRAAALLRYKILAGLMGFLSVGLLSIGIIAVVKYPEGGFGPPYFVGCFFVGILGMIHAAVCTFIAFKGGEFAKDDIKKREIGCAITGQYILSMFLFMGCFIGTILAGIGGMNTDTYGFDDEGTGYEDKVKLLAGIIIAGCILALGVNIFGMFIVCTYGSYFGVRVQNRRNGRTVILFEHTGTVSTTNTAYGGSGMGGMGTNANTQNLQEQNRLLQEQLRLQQELINTQQRAQGPQFGVYPPPPANYPSGGTYPASDPAYPPGPPPSYGNI